VTNPFAQGPGKGNQTEQMRAIKANPEAAFRQMAEAGFHPRDFGVTDTTKHGVALVNDVVTQNLWLDGPAKGNHTARMAALAADPEKAMRDILAVDLDPRDFGINPATYGFQVVTTEVPNGK